MIETGLAQLIVDAVPELIDETYVDGRVFPQILPESVAYPAVTFDLENDERLDTMDGPMGLVDALYAVVVWDLNYSRMLATEQQVRLALNGFQGPMGDVIVARVAYRGREDHDPRPLIQSDEAPGLHFRTGLYSIAYDESALLAT